jgi:glyoxylase-like metal-dependent hydrolase (beta-lactamase superfamily II)
MKTMSDGLLIYQLSVGPLQVNCFLVACQKTQDAMVIDPGEEGARIIQLAQNEGLKISKVINTHGHFDHIGANQHVVLATGAKLMLHAADLPLLQNARNHAGIYGLNVVPSPDPDRLLEQGDTLEVGDHSFEVFHVPGHSPGGICLLSDGHIFVGDVLFAGSIGRTDLPGGDFDLLVKSVRERLLSLPDQTVVHPGHGPDTTIGRERRHNPFVGDDAWR